MSFDASYREELAFLREMGREVARARPGLCDALAEPGADPDVERLLEGFAFLAARTRERADDAIPEAIEAIAEVIAPHALRSIPASTVMELRPRASLVRERVVVAKGAAFGARPIEGVRCELRSTTDVDLVPLVVERVVLEQHRARGARLVISLRAPRAALDAVHVPRPVRFFVHAPLAAASALALAIDRHLERVSFRTDATEIVLGKTARLVDPDREPHLPWPEETPDGARHLVELAYFPERHLFVDVEGLERVPSASRAERFDLCLDLAAEAPLPDRLAEDALRLHCVPAINLFPCDADPITWRDDLRDAPLRAAGLPPGAFEVHDVTSVVGLAESARTRRVYRSFASFDHLAPAASNGYFALRRARSPLDGAVDTFVRVGARATSSSEALSIEMRCTNRLLVAQLRSGDVCEPIAGSPAIATFTNLTPLGPRSSARVGSDALYALVGASRSGHRARRTANALRAWLATCAVPPSVDVGRARACASLRESICEVHEHPFRAARRGVVERGVSLDLEIDEARARAGEAFLLARALDHALAADLPLNVRQRLSMTLLPSRTRIELPPRGGIAGL